MPKKRITTVRKHSRGRSTVKRHNRKVRSGRFRSGTKELKNLKMSNEVFVLRRKIINLIHDAKRLTPLPRITVRITEDARHRAILGQALIKGNMIWIPLRAFEETKNDLRHIVYHELLHSVYGVGHKKSGIMVAAIIRGRTKSTIDKLFLKEIKLLTG